VQHSNGGTATFGDAYFDCDPLGTPGTDSYTQNMAFHAANVWTPPIAGASTTSALFCDFDDADPDNDIFVVCRQSTAVGGGQGYCACWGYDAGPDNLDAIGRVLYTSDGVDNDCRCSGGSSGTTWN
jgi:hypothetical protein